MNTLKIIVIGAALVLSSQAFAQSFDRGTNAWSGDAAGASQTIHRFR